MLWIISIIHSLKHDTKYTEVHKDNNNYTLIQLLVFNLTQEKVQKINARIDELWPLSLQRIKACCNKIMPSYLGSSNLVLKRGMVKIWCMRIFSTPLP